MPVYRVLCNTNISSKAFKKNYPSSHYRILVNSISAEGVKLTEKSLSTYHERKETTYLYFFHSITSPGAPDLPFCPSKNCFSLIIIISFLNHPIGFLSSTKYFYPNPHTL